MSLQPATVEFLQYLRQNPQIRDQIKARSGKTVLYAGKLILPAWREVDRFRETFPEYADKQTLPEVLALIALPGCQYDNLYQYLAHICENVPERPDQFVLWRAVSGIFAKNAVGSVSFCIGSEVTRAEKVFAATEIYVLMRNPNIDELTRDVLSYYKRCLENEDHAMNFSFFSAT